MIDNYFAKLHKKALHLAKKRGDELRKTDHSLALINTGVELHYKHTVLADYFFPLFEDSDFDNELPKLFSTTWERIWNVYPDDYSISKELSYFKENNPWFSLTWLSYCHRHWLHWKETGKMLMGELIK